ncbi:MAG: response regulator transcription factor [Longicatena sp.]
MYQVLLVDDDVDIQITNKTYLMKQGFRVLCAQNSQECMNLISTCAIDCIILDIMLEKESGYDVCEKIKKITNTPIIFLTSLIEKQEIEHGFICGGDDYMIKPYDLRELELRIHARIRQHNHDDKNIKLIQSDPIVINLDARSVHLNHHAIITTSFEFDILVLLIKNPKRVFTIGQIYQLIWRMPDIENAQTVQVHIAHLRKKLDKSFPEHHFIQTVWGKGYMFCEYNVRKD